MKDLPIACSLDAAGMAERGQEFSSFQAISAARIEGGISVTFAPDLEAAVRDFARRESECCPFLQLRVTAEPDAVRLDVTGPPDAQPIVESFLALANG